MSEFPEDIMKAAEETLDIMLCESSESCGGSEGVRNHAIGTIAAAILAERERCAGLSRKWGETCRSIGQYVEADIAEDIAVTIEDSKQ